MQYEGVDGEVEIESLEEDEEYVKVSNSNDLEKLVTAMGFPSIPDFEKTCHATSSQLINKFWTIVRDVVFLKEWEGTARQQDSIKLKGKANESRSSTMASVFHSRTQHCLLRTSRSGENNQGAGTRKDSC